MSTDDTHLRYPPEVSHPSGDLGCPRAISIGDMDIHLRWFTWNIHQLFPSGCEDPPGMSDRRITQYLSRMRAWEKGIVWDIGITWGVRLSMGYGYHLGYGYRLGFPPEPEIFQIDAHLGDELSPI